MPPQRRFQVAGLVVELSAAAAEELGDLSASYEAYPPEAERTPDVVLEIERPPGFAENRPRGPGYPAFETELAGTRLCLDRFDASGWIDLASEPLRGHFCIGASANSLEAVVRIGASIGLPRRGALIVHSSCVADRHGAHLFAGVSGAGKSTIARLLAEGLGNRIETVADELVILAPAPDGWRAHVAPFLAKLALPHGSSRPLASINFLEQAPRHERTPVPAAAALRELLRHVLVYARDPRTADLVLDAAAGLLASVPAYRLRFAKDPGVAEVLSIT